MYGWACSKKVWELRMLPCKSEHSPPCLENLHPDPNPPTSSDLEDFPDSPAWDHPSPFLGQTIKFLTCFTEYSLLLLVRATLAKPPRFGVSDLELVTFLLSILLHILAAKAFSGSAFHSKDLMNK